MSAVNLNQNSRMLRRIAQPAKPENRRNWCPSCEKTIEPSVDSHGPFCPWCHKDVPSPMERGAIGGE